MKTIVSLLKLPWRARIPSGKGLLSMVLVSFVLAALVRQQIHALDGWQQAGVAALVFAIAVVWITLPNVSWLARDAGALRIPGVEREPDRCLLLYVVLSILVPTLVLGTLFGHALAWLVSLALVASAVFALNVSPIWIAWGCVLIVIGLVVSGDPRYLA